MLKSIIFAAFFAISSFAFAETTGTGAANDLELVNKGVECAGRCGSHHHHHRRCCGCSRKGGVFKSKTLNNLFLDYLLMQSPNLPNLVDVTNFQVIIKQAFFPGPGHCFTVTLNWEGFLNWFYGQGWFHVYPVFEQGEEAYEQHDGCVVVPYDVLGVTPVVAKEANGPLYTVTPAYKVKTTWCIDDDCNWKLTGMEWHSFACLNVNSTVCPPP
jgi:hypothetical protein